MTVFPRHLAARCGCDDPSFSSGLISIDEALQRIAARVKPIGGTETIPLDQAHGRVLATSIRARADMPRFDHAAMDGYAVNSAMLEGEGPWHLPVNGRVAAGEPILDRPFAGGACRIFTGAPVPQDLDSVVVQEKVVRSGNTIRLTHRPAAGENNRRRGETHCKGAEILPAGAVLTPRAIAACAAAGHGCVDAQKPVRVTLLVSGSEVTMPGTDGLAPGQIWDVNTPMLQALLSRPEVDLQEVITVDDDETRIRKQIENASKRADLIVTTGGVSVGEEDHFHNAIKSLQVEIFFAGVAMKPGKPVALGRVGDAIWLGLPGNPGAAFVTWSVFGQVVLNTLVGKSQTHLHRRHVVLGHPLPHKAGRCEIRATKVIGVDVSGREIVECPSNVSSGQVSHLAGCDGLTFIPADIDHMPAGALLAFLPFLQ